MRVRRLVPAAAIALAIGWTASASGATIVVNVTNDAPDGGIGDTGCTLREAVRSANTNVPGTHCNADTAGADTIVLEAGKTYKLTNHAAPEDANVSGDLDISGGGGTTIRSDGPGLATIDADSVVFPGDDDFRGRAIDILNGAGAVTLQGVRIINGAVTTDGLGGGGGILTRAPLTLIDSEVSGNSVARFGGNPGTGGGGILVQQGGALTMTGSTVAGNSVQGDVGVTVAQGGGIAFESIGNSLTATNSTISGNVVDSVSTTTEARGAGIAYGSGESMALTNVTINRNSSIGPSTSVHSGGIFLQFQGEMPTIRGSILAGNQANSQVDCAQGSTVRDLVSLGDNLLGPAATANCGAVAASNDLTGVTNPNVAPLAPFGGPTPTQLPNPGSPAIDHGGTCPATDQRGLFRVPAAPCDAGAVEVGATSTLPTDPTPPSNDISFGAVTRNKRKGTATLAVSVPSAGELALAGNGLKAASATASGAGEVALSVKAAGKAKRKLRRKGKKTFTPAVTFTPVGGAANTESTSVKLVRR
jgi:CSLREA domain-containing protein